MKEKILQYINETVVELKKTTWPSKDELVGSTIVTIFVSVILAIFVFFVDQGFSRVISLVLG
jgi:preprotein translocase subunit SecE